MDRNIPSSGTLRNTHKSLSARRAWIEMQSFNSKLDTIMSLSARRAWIEIYFILLCYIFYFLSLSARRAWIEMSVMPVESCGDNVALRKESVDRN